MPPRQNPIGRLEERVRTLESLLKAEQARCQTQDKELAKLRLQAKQVENLQAELTVERESGKLLVQWLQEAEGQLAKVRCRRGPETERPQQGISAIL